MTEQANADGAILVDSEGARNGATISAGQHRSPEEWEMGQTIFDDHNLVRLRLTWIAGDEQPKPVGR